MSISNTWKYRAAVLGTLLGIGIVLRSAYVFTLDDRIYWVDEKDYLRLAQQLTEGGTHGFHDTDLPDLLGDNGIHRVDDQKSAQAQ